jgi:hypothetical protein
VDRRLLLRGRPTDRRAVATRVDLGHRHHAQHGARRGRDEQLLGTTEMGTIPVILLAGSSTGRRCSASGGTTEMRSCHLARRFKYGTPMFSIWRRCLWTNREAVPLPNRTGSIVDLHTEEASPGRPLVAEIRQICVTAKEIFLSQLTLLELEVPYEQDKLDGMVDTFQKDISTNISWIPTANTRSAEEEEVLTTSPNRCLMNCFNLLQIYFSWDAVLHRQPWPPPHMYVEFGCGSADLRPIPWPSFTTIVHEVLNRVCTDMKQYKWEKELINEVLSAESRPPVSGVAVDFADTWPCYESKPYGVRGYVIKGIPNLRNTCYLSAVLRCLFVLDEGSDSRLGAIHVSVREGATDDKVNFVKLCAGVQVWIPPWPSFSGKTQPLELMRLIESTSSPNFLSDRLSPQLADGWLFSIKQ